jgi:acyl carrier protein
LARREKARDAPVDKGHSFRPAQISAEARVNMGTDIPSEVKRIIKEQLDVDETQIKPEASFIDDLGADSLGLVELVLAFEETFHFDIPDEDTEKIRTVADAIRYIEQYASA